MTDPVYIQRDDSGNIAGYAASPQPETPRFDAEPTAWDDAAFQAWVAAQAAPKRRLIRKSVVQDRLIAMDKIKPILNVLRADGNEAYYVKWFAPDWPRVYFDDPDMLTLLGVISLTADQIATVTAPDPGAG